MFYLFLSASTASQTMVFFYLDKGNKYLLGNSQIYMAPQSTLKNVTNVHTFDSSFTNIWLKFVISILHSIFTSGLEINLFHYGCTCSEADEIYKICSVIGSPTAESWADGLKLARDINYQFPQVSSLNLNLLLNGGFLFSLISH
jgi:hypothetical protein